MGLLAWTKASDKEGAGVDHLGMRVAGEQAYSAMIDFNTTVAWRPRYCSFFCWLTKFAFIKAGGDPVAPSNEIDRNLYLKTIKRVEYAIAAATILSNENVMRIAGSINITKNIEAAEKSGKKTIRFLGDHLRSANGGLSVYAGHMRALNLVASDSGVDVPLPQSDGDKLAESFEYSINQDKKIKEIFCSESASLEDLKKIGEYCSLSNISDFAKRDLRIKSELDQLRSIIVDWEKFDLGNGPSSRRVLSLGLILNIRKQLSEETSSLYRFQEMVLLGGVKLNGNIEELKLPLIYGKVIKEWKSYLIHSYTTFALEGLLGVLLSSSFELQREIGGKLTQEVLFEVFIQKLEKGSTQTGYTLPSELANWWENSLSDLKNILSNFIKRGRHSPITEPDLMANIQLNTKKLDVADLNDWAHDAALMFVFVLTRQFLFHKKFGDSYWLGSNESFRLPPSTLQKNFEQHCLNNTSVKEYLKFACDNFVLKQHDRNALRKLAVQPKQDTVKFVKQGSSFIPLSTHEPGTSNPRYDNTISYLQDLGYLTYSEQPVPTLEGLSLIQKIEAFAK